MVFISPDLDYSLRHTNVYKKEFNLSYPQGKFLFHLPFPTAEPVTITELMTKAGVDKNNIPEIIDIVQELIELNVIESSQG